MRTERWLAHIYLTEFVVAMSLQFPHYRAIVRFRTAVTASTECLAWAGVRPRCLRRHAHGRPGISVGGGPANSSCDRETIVSAPPAAAARLSTGHRVMVERKAARFDVDSHSHGHRDGVDERRLFARAEDAPRYKKAGGGGDKSVHVEFLDMHELDGPRPTDSPRNACGKAATGHRTSARYREPRMSLLGKPLNYRAHFRDARSRRAQAKIYNFLERPKDWRAISYHLLMWVFLSSMFYASAFEIVHVSVFVLLSSSCCWCDCCWCVCFCPSVFKLLLMRLLLMCLLLFFCLQVVVDATAVDVSAFVLLSSSCCWCEGCWCFCFCPSIVRLSNSFVSAMTSMTQEK